MKMEKYVLTLALLLLSSSSYCGWLIEPEVGYQAGTTFTYRYAGVKYDFTETSVPVGLRLDWVSSHGIFFGVHGVYFMSGAFAKLTAGAADDTFTRVIGSVELGYLSGRYKIFASYDPANNITNTPATVNSAFDFKELNGTSFTVGFGIMLTNHFGIDAQYSVPTYTSAKFNNGTTTYSTLNNSNYSSITDGQAAVLLTIPFGGRGK